MAKVNGVQGSLKMALICAMLAPTLASAYQDVELRRYCAAAKPLAVPALARQIRQAEFRLSMVEAIDRAQLAAARKNLRETCAVAWNFKIVRVWRPN